MTSPFMALNAATLRTERRALLARMAAQLLIFGGIAATAVAIGAMILTSALALPDLINQAATLKGM